MILQITIQCTKNVRNGMFIFIKIYLNLFVEIILSLKFSLNVEFICRNLYGKKKINYQLANYGLNFYVFILNNLNMMNML